MKIISHRGYWKKPLEKNTANAFKRSFDFGYGTETDIRDYAGELVISHDMPLGDELRVSEFLSIYKDSGCEGVLALNIKSDGLQKPLKKMLDQYKVEKYFLFDMSVPDAVVSLKEGLISYTRQSEFEKECQYYESAAGVWMDEFETAWIEHENVLTHLRNNKSVCIVSPELHGREPTQKWKQYRELTRNFVSDRVTLCTDLPEQAMKVINDKD